MYGDFVYPLFTESLNLIRQIKISEALVNVATVLFY